MIKIACTIICDECGEELNTHVQVNEAVEYTDYGSHGLGVMQFEMCDVELPLGWRRPPHSVNRLICSKH
jgi:hypothetical protein